METNPKFNSDLLRYHMQTHTVISTSLNLPNPLPRTPPICSAFSVTRRRPRVLKLGLKIVSASTQGVNTLVTRSPEEKSNGKQRLAKLSLLQQERDAAIETAMVCSKRSHRLLMRVQNLKQYAKERRDANDEVAAASTLKTKEHVHAILEKTISRAKNNFNLAAKLEEFIAYLQHGIAQGEGVVLPAAVSEPIMSTTASPPAVGEDEDHEPTLRTGTDPSLSDASSIRLLLPPSSNGSNWVSHTVNSMDDADVLDAALVKALCGDQGEGEESIHMDRQQQVITRSESAGFQHDVGQPNPTSSIELEEGLQELRLAIVALQAGDAELGKLDAVYRRLVEIQTGLKPGT